MGILSRKKDNMDTQSLDKRDIEKSLLSIPKRKRKIDKIDIVGSSDDENSKDYLQDDEEVDEFRYGDSEESNFYSYGEVIEDDISDSEDEDNLDYTIIGNKVSPLDEFSRTDDDIVNERIEDERQRKANMDMFDNYSNSVNQSTTNSVFSPNTRDSTNYALHELDTSLQNIDPDNIREDLDRKYFNNIEFQGLVKRKRELEEKGVELDERIGSALEELQIRKDRLRDILDKLNEVKEKIKRGDLCEY